MSAQKYQALDQAFVAATKETSELVAYDKDFKSKVTTYMMSKIDTAQSVEVNEQRKSNAEAITAVLEQLKAGLNVAAMAESMDIDPVLLLKAAGMNEELTQAITTKKTI